MEFLCYFIITVARASTRSSLSTRNESLPEWRNAFVRLPKATTRLASCRPSSPTAFHRNCRHNRPCRIAPSHRAATAWRPRWVRWIFLFVSQFPPPPILLPRFPFFIPNQFFSHSFLYKNLSAFHFSSILDYFVTSDLFILGFDSFPYLSAIYLIKFLKIILNHFH